MLILQTKTKKKKKKNLRLKYPHLFQNNAPLRKVPLIFFFSYHDFQLRFFIIDCDLNEYVHILAIVLVIFDKLIQDSPNVCECLTLN